MEKIIEEIENIKFLKIEELEKIEQKDLENIIHNISFKTKIDKNLLPFKVLIGLPGSGKSYAAYKYNEKFNKEILSTDSFFKKQRENYLNGIYHPYIDYFCKKYKNEIKKYDLNITNSDTFSKFKLNDIFKELEMGLFIYHFFNGDFKDKILDLGSSTPIQPSIIKLLQNTDIEYINIKQEDRINNLYKDFIMKSTKRKTCVFKVLKTLKNNYKIKNIEEKIEDLKSIYKDTNKIVLNEEEKEIEIAIKNAIKEYDNNQQFKTKFYEELKNY